MMRRTLAVLALVIGAMSATVAPATADPAPAAHVIGDHGPSTLREAPGGPRVVTTTVEWLTLDLGDAPADLWLAALDEDAVWGDPDDGADRLYVPVGYWIPVRDGGYLATADGWMVCEDGITAPEVDGGMCSATGAVEPLAGLLVED